MIFRLQTEPLSMRRALLALPLAAAVGLAACASHPHKATKKETLHFIADKVNQQGTVNVADYMHDNATGKNDIVRQSFEQTRLAIDPHSDCKLSYHKKITVNGKITVDSDFWTTLRGVNRVEIIPIEQAWKLADARNSDTTLSYKADPSVSVLRLNVANGNYYELYFYEKDLADRMEKAFAHLVEMCGGGKEVF